MVFGLIGLLFNLVTFPGIIVNSLVQNVYVDKYSVPTETVPVAGGLDGIDDIDDDDLAALASALSEEDDEESEEVIQFDQIETYGDIFKVALMPFFVCSLLAFGIFLVGVPFFTDGIPYYAMLWLGVSMGAHAFPNDSATTALWNRSKSTDSLLRVLGYPTVALSKLANLLRFLWFDAIYALGIYVAVDVGLYETLLGL